MKRLKLEDSDIIKAISESKSMSEACVKLNIRYITLKKHAQRLNIFKPNQSGKGLNKKRNCIYDLNDILKGKHPQIQSFKLKQRLYKAGIKENKCEECNISEWNGKNIECELDHINGKCYDHRLENLRILCPNCHSQTETFRSKNLKNK